MTLKTTSVQQPPSDIFLKFSDEVLTLSIIVVTGGIGFIDSYYKRFGINYQSIDLTVTTILYQGLKLALRSPYIIVMYLIQIIWMVIAKLTNKSKVQRFFYGSFYIITIIIIVIVYNVASYNGEAFARFDMQKETSSLPRIRSLISPSINIKEPEDSYLMLNTDDTYLTIFKPIEITDKYAAPNLTKILKTDIKILETYYSETK